MKNQSRPDKTNCEGCQTTDILEERRKFNQEISDERWKGLARMGKVSLAIISLIIAIPSTGLWFTLSNMNSNISELNTTMRQYVGVSESNKQKIEDLARRQDSDTLWLSGRIEENGERTKLNSAWIKAVESQCQRRNK